MMESNRKLNTKLVITWLIVGLLSWPVGFMVAVLLSEIAINPWHPKPTNVLIGLSMGAAAGFGQWYVLRKSLPLGKWWIWASSLGVGVPFAVTIILAEFGVSLPGVLNDKNILWPTTFVTCGALAGILQINIISKYFHRAWLWIVVSVVAWTTSFALNFTIVLPGLILFVISGAGLVWVLKNN